MHRASAHDHAGHFHGTIHDHIELAHDERHLRRKVLKTVGGEDFLVDLKEAVAFVHGDVLILEDGRLIEVRAANEHLHEITPRNPLHLSELCWHLGNRHLAAQIEPTRILVLRDHVIRGMLEGLGARVCDVFEPFQPLHGAYHGGHGHDQHHHHGHRHD